MASISSFSSRIRQPPPPSKVSAFQFQHPARTSSRAAVTSSKPGDDEVFFRCFDAGEADPMPAHEGKD
ncbi:hypothetical protein J5N97_018758 [Dioscorea zingiberensis]|uniref:Uncharacterized protein n=1 Tax=Dioscorea zingiberensis TaxID=325984 RepID=A0A9D5CD91_9LILI|nr:hypothetical protein J5N97_018758 [Dioscorea zingiberensis]